MIKNETVERPKFLVVREDWSEYKIKKDNSIVKLKASVTDVVDTKKEGKNRLKFEFSSQFFKSPTEDDKGAPSEDVKINPEDVIEDLEVEKINEPMNIYDIPDMFMITMKVRLITLKKTGKYNQKGERIYQYETVCDVSMMKYPDYSPRSF